MLHFYGNLLYLLVLLFFSFLFNCVFDSLEASVCVLKNTVCQRFSGALVLVLKKKKDKKSKPCSDRQVL